MTEKKEEVNYVPECQKEEGEVEIPVNELKEDKYDKRYKKRLKEKGLLKKEFTTMYMRKDIKRELDKLKVCENEKYCSVIKRLIDRRNWDVINGGIISFDAQEVARIKKEDLGDKYDWISDSSVQKV